MQTGRSFINNVAKFASKELKDNTMQPGTRCLAAFFLVAVGLSVLFKILDSCFFSDDHLGVVEICAVLLCSIVIAAKRLSRWKLGEVPGKVTGVDAFLAGRRVLVGGAVTPVPVQTQTRRRTRSDASNSPKRKDPNAWSNTNSTTNSSNNTSASLVQMIDSGTEVDASELLHGIASACRSGSLVMAEKFLGNLTRCSPASLSSPKKAGISDQVHAVIEACLASAGARCASTWLVQLQTGGVQLAGQTLLLVLDALVEAGELAEVEQLLTRMEAAEFSIDAPCYQVLFQHCIPASDTKRATMWLQSASKKSNAAELSHAYAGLIRARALGPACEDVSLQDANSDGVLPSIVHQVDFWMTHAFDAGVVNSTKILNAAIHAYTRAGETQKAEFWLLKMEENAQKYSPIALDTCPGSPYSGQHFAPDIFSYSAVMDSYAQQGDVAKAEALFARMTEVGIRPDVVSFNTVIKAHTRNGNVKGAEKWLEKAGKHNVQLDAFGYNAVIAAAARAGDSDTAERCLLRMVKDGAQADVVSYNSVIHAWAKHGDATSAVRLVDMMLQNGVEPDVVTLGAVVHACARAGDAHQAECVFQKIVARGRATPDAISYNAMIDAFVKSGDTLHAERWLAIMLEQGVTPGVVSYTTVLHAHARAGDIEAAERGLKRMLDAGIEANVVSYSALIHACVKAGDIERAEKWFETMRAKGVQANVVSYSVILNVCAKAGDIARAEHWLEQMCADGVAPNVVCYNNMIDACAKAGKGGRAEYWLRQLCEASKSQTQEFRRSSDRSPNAHNNHTQPLAPTRQSYTTAAQPYATHGQWADVERIFQDMQAGGLSMDEFSLTVLLSAYTRARPRQREKAEATFEKHVANKLPVTKPALRVLRSIVGAQRFEELLQNSPPETRRLW